MECLLFDSLRLMSDRWTCVVMDPTRCIYVCLQPSSFRKPIGTIDVIGAQLTTISRVEGRRRHNLDGNNIQVQEATEFFLLVHLKGCGYITTCCLLFSQVISEHSTTDPEPAPAKISTFYPPGPLPPNIPPPPFLPPPPNVSAAPLIPPPSKICFYFLILYLYCIVLIFCMFLTFLSCFSLQGCPSLSLLLVFLHQQVAPLLL